MSIKRNIKYIVVHCTATAPNTSIESIKRYWKEKRGWGEKSFQKKEGASGDKKKYRSRKETGRW